MGEPNVAEVQTDIGPLLVLADDMAITPIIRSQGTWKEDLGARLRRLLRPGMVAVDVGGNIGYLALLMAEQVGPSGRVVAVEPDPGKAEVLRRNAERSRGAPIVVIEAAAWSESGERELGLQATEAVDDPVGVDAQQESVRVRAVRLDDVLPERVDLIRLDTRAGEHVALLGARRTIERSRPRLLAEFWPQGLRETGHDPVSVLDGYRAMGLRTAGAEGELPEDPGELVRAIDAAETPSTTLLLEPIDPPSRPLERLLPGDRLLGRTWSRRFPGDAEPGTLAYDATHRALVSSLLDSEEWGRLFADGGRLPPGLGIGSDERVVEYPWLFSRRLQGRVLDAGSVLNHRHVAERALQGLDELTIVTLAPEPIALTSLGISYLYGDLRDLPLRDDWFDEVVCLSTLEHVGMDNSVYGSAGRPAEDPRGEAKRALGELLRVVKPGGRVHLSLPFGRREDHGWFRQLDREDVDDLLAVAGDRRREETLYAYTRQGWRRSSARRAGGARYNADRARGSDGAVAARAVICLTIFS